MSFSLKDRWRLEQHVSRRLTKLQNDYLANAPAAKALLAQLRRMAAKQPGEVAETWVFEFGGLTAPLLGSGSQPATEGEWAIHVAMTLYAVHQQSKQEKMFRSQKADEARQYGLGNAAKLLAISKSDKSVEQLEQGEMPRRFSALVNAESITEVAHYARQLVQQFRDLGIPLDYGRLAGQLYEYQFRNLRKRVALEWAREFSRWADRAEAGKEQ